MVTAHAASSLSSSGFYLISLVHSIHVGVEGSTGLPLVRRTGTEGRDRGNQAPWGWGGLMGAGLREGGKQTRQGKGKRKLETSPRGKTRHLETPSVEGGGNSCKGALLTLLRHAARIGATCSSPSHAMRRP
jgi:hypothetical protein